MLALNKQSLDNRSLGSGDDGGSENDIPFFLHPSIKFAIVYNIYWQLWSNRKRRSSRVRKVTRAQHEIFDFLVNTERWGFRPIICQIMNQFCVVLFLLNKKKIKKKILPPLSHTHHMLSIVRALLYIYRQ